MEFVKNLDHQRINPKKCSLIKFLNLLLDILTILEVEQNNFFSYDNYKMPMVGVKMHQCNNCIFLTEIRAPALSFGVPIARASIAALPGPRLPFCLTQGAPSGPNDFIDLHLEQMQSRKGYISSIFLQIDLSNILSNCLL